MDFPLYISHYRPADRTYHDLFTEDETSLILPGPLLATAFVMQSMPASSSFAPSPAFQRSKSFQEIPKLQHGRVSMRLGETARHSVSNILVGSEKPTETEKLEACLKLHGVKAPGFEADAPADFYKNGNDIKNTRQEIASASNELSNLMRGPDETLRWTSVRVMIPALKPGARGVINEHCLSESGKENPWDEKQIRDMDILMLTMLNAEGRDEAAFKRLFQAADSRFDFQRVKRIENGRMAIIEAVWNPDSKTAA